MYKKGIFKKVAALLIIFTMVFGMLPTMGFGIGTVYAEALTPTLGNPDTWDGTVLPILNGDGSINDPYRIESAEQLAYLAQQVNIGKNYMDQHFLLTVDIDLTGQEWIPIGKELFKPFSGTLDGAGHVIFNLTIGSTSQPNNQLDRAGLFGQTMGANIKNIGVENIGIYVDNTTASAFVGGLIGSAIAEAGRSTHVINCYTTGTIINYSKLNSTAGGLIGDFRGMLDLNSANPPVNEFGAYNCYSTVNVTGDTYYHAGGFLGQVVGNMTIENCYAAGKTSILGAGSTAGFLGGILSGVYKNPTFTNCYWNSSDNSVSCGWNGDIGPGSTSAYMKSDDFMNQLNSNRETNPEAATWKFVTDKNGGYPMLKGIGNIDLTYTIGTLNDQSLTPLTVGYTAGSQQTATITINKTGTGDLTNLAVQLGGADAADFELGALSTANLDNVTSSATFTVKAKDELATGTYTATVTVTADNLNPVTFSVTQEVNIAVAPTIETQPQNQTVTEGQTATFTIAAAGTGPLTYQWKKDGNNIEGATTATLTISDAQAADAGSYSVVVTNQEGSVISNTATLTVNKPDDPNVRHMVKDGNVFLGGKYIELGISPAGYFGTTVAAPKLSPDPGGFHTEGMYENKLGMRIDGDGFDIGEPPTTGDFFLPGSPTEGFGLGYKLTAEGLPEVLVNYNGGAPELTNITSEDASSENILKAIITGTTPDGSLEITQEIWFAVDDKVFKTNISVKNLTEASLYDIRYTRSVDPDQDLDKNGSYATKNSVISNPPANGSAIVIAKGAMTEEPFIFMATDAAARAAIAGADLLDPYSSELWLEDGSKLLEAEATDDTGIHLTFKIGDLLAGASKTVVMNSSLNPNLDEALKDVDKAPGAPINVTATAGNGQATVSFTAPVDDGGMPITGYTVTSNPGNITASGTTSPITVTGLNNGTTYTFTVTATNAAGTGAPSGASDAVTPYAPSSSGSSSSSEATKPGATGVEILVNGKIETAATAITTKDGNKTVTTITVDDKKVEEKLSREGQNTVVTIPVKTKADVVVGQLNGQTVKNMENKEAVLKVKTDDITYTLPAAQINIDAVSEQIGKQVELKDIAINVKISASTQETVKIVEAAANKKNYQVVVKPVEFEITCTSGNKAIEVSRFNAYVERLVAIPDGIDPNKITTGIVFNPDGRFSHVPTVITAIDGRYYAKINSLTNSTYSIIWSPKTFADVENHWAKDAVNDMGSRLVISGVGDDRFAPDRDITRAEFAAIVVRGLGLMRSGTGKDVFNDVAKKDWYYDAVSIASEYGIISGYGNGKYGPQDKITREQAMAMIARAMEITQLKVEFKAGEADQLITAFADSEKPSDWAKDYIASCIKAETVHGRSGKLIAPKDYITRAEVASIVKRLLQKSDLI